MPKKVAITWTGGKDCALAFYKVWKNPAYTIDRLITFCPPNPEFLAHPIPLIKQQIESMGIQHQYLEITAPFDLNYEKQINSLINDGVEVIVTGDIDEVNGAPNYIDQRCEHLNIEVVKPLWQQDRISLFHEYLDAGLEVVITCVHHDFFDQSWLGERLNLNMIDKIIALNKKNGVDPCGENGEYHTFTMNAPYFTNPIELPPFKPSQKGELWYCKLVES